MDTGKRLTIKILFIFLVRMLARLDEKQYQEASRIVKESTLPEEYVVNIMSMCDKKRA